MVSFSFFCCFGTSSALKEFCFVLFLFLFLTNWELGLWKLLCIVHSLFFLQRLLIAQVDNVDTSACIISPQQVKYEFSFFFLSKKKIIVVV